MRGQDRSGQVTEAAAERAIKVLKNAIEAAENSNQAGEDFVVAAAAGPVLLVALEEARDQISGMQAQFDHAGCTCTFPDDDCCSYAAAEATVALADAAIAKAKGGAK